MSVLAKWVFAYSSSCILCICTGSSAVGASNWRQTQVYIPCWDGGSCSLLSVSLALFCFCILFIFLYLILFILQSRCTGCHQQWHAVQAVKLCSKKIFQSSTQVLPCNRGKIDVVVVNTIAFLQFSLTAFCWSETSYLLLCMLFL